MRVETSGFSVSWIPSYGVTGANKAVFDSGIGHYDNPPPEEISGRSDLIDLRDNDGFRFANYVSAWAEFEEGKAVYHGFGKDSGGLMGATTVKIGPAAMTMMAPNLPILQRVDSKGHEVRFEQTYGGHTAFPMPRRVNHPPFFQFKAPTVWTTLILTLRADGTSSIDVKGASPFPRHWVYDHQGKLSSKVGVADFKTWYRHAFGKQSPWGRKQFDAIVTDAESDLERGLSFEIMNPGHKPNVETFKKGSLLTEQGTPGDTLYLILNGVVDVEVDGVPVVQLGPGTVIGERALLEGGLRTATVRCTTKVKVASAKRELIDLTKLEKLRELHKRESTTSA